jgi:hypothetical protein
LCKVLFNDKSPIRGECEAGGPQLQPSSVIGSRESLNFVGLEKT